ncbi:ubiquitin-protein ligase, putative [Plasmodium vinckei]|uniref:Ubiquitin-protein ligase, putative n=1 Tax=Plasmodium vinckei TaxID=5860 RepID=A0A6V7SHM6_PLAVN|nr:ubiquitin-protein ligase, putative [Plasmodium vinckei]
MKSNLCIILIFFVYVINKTDCFNNVITNNTRFLSKENHLKIREYNSSNHNKDEISLPEHLTLKDTLGYVSTLLEVDEYDEGSQKRVPLSVEGGIVENEHENGNENEVMSFASNTYNADKNNNGIENNRTGTDNVEYDNSNNNEEENERKKLFDLAMELKDGSKDRKKDIQKSIKIFEKLIMNKKKDQITSLSYYELGKIYFFGYKNYFFAYKRNIKLSLYYLKKSSEMKNPGAFHFLSFIYFFEFNRKPNNEIVEEIEEGRKKKGVNNHKKRPNDEVKIRTHFIKKAIEYEIEGCLLNYTPSILAMGYRYLYGIHLKKNCEKSKDYYKLIAENVMNSDYINIPLSDLDLLNKGNINIHNEISNLKNNEEEILEFLKEQIKGGDVMAMYDLGKKYKDEKNFTQAFEYINEASKKNNILALKELGIIYLYGYGTEKDIKKSIENFSKAAEAGDVESKCYLGYIYYFIDGHRDLKLSLKYLTEAANHDHAEALFFLAEIILDISVKKRHISDNVYKIVFKLYEHSADLGYVQGYFREAQLYEIGKGIKESCLNSALSYKFVAESTPWANEIRQGMNYYIEKDFIKSFYTYALAAYEGYEVAQSNFIYIYKNNNLKNYVKPEKVMHVLHLLYNQGNYKTLYEMGEIYKEQNKQNLSIYYHKMGLNKGDLRNLLPLSYYYEQNKDNDRALKYVSYFIKQTGREQESNDTKMEKIKSILDKSLLYFRKYKLFFKTFYNTKKKEKKKGA